MQQSPFLSKGGALQRERASKRSRESRKGTAGRPRKFPNQKNRTQTFFGSIACVICQRGLIDEFFVPCRAGGRGGGSGTGIQHSPPTQVAPAPEGSGFDYRNPGTVPLIAICAVGSLAITDGNRISPSTQAVEGVHVRIAKANRRARP